MAWGIAAALIISAAGSYIASQKQSKALKQAAEEGAQATRNAQSEALALYNRIYEDTSPYRQAALSLLPQFVEGIQRPGESAQFAADLEIGLRGIQGTLAPYGLTDSSTAARKVGEYASALTRSERAASLQGLQLLANVGMVGQNIASDVLAGNIQNTLQGRLGLIDLTSARGAVQAAGAQAMAESAAAAVMYRGSQGRSPYGAAGDAYLATRQHRSTSSI